jgi:lysophospholipase L1-like esterase
VAKGLPPSAFNTGFVDVFAARLRQRNPKLEVVNYGCPGESTVTFARGGCPWLAEGRKLHRPFRGSQLQSALSFLRAHPGQVSPITLTLFGNDIIPRFDGCGKNLVACVNSKSASVIAAFVGRFRPLLQRLRTAAPGAEIIVTGGWNLDEEHPNFTAPLFRPLNEAIAREASAVKARFADPMAFFNVPGNTAANKARLCAYTYICSNDPHPTDAGYRAYARAVIAASSYTR